MSNSLAIASVTATIQGVVSDTGIKATAQSPDKVQPGASGTRLNVFLFHTLPNAAWRNTDMIGQVRPGESGFPPLALNLHYLLTAYGGDGETGELDAQQILGEAMRALHDRPVLSGDDIRSYARGKLTSTNLDQQIENIHITHDPLSHEDLFRMWSTFNTPYRVSAAYQVSVVLIDSQRPTTAPPPVLRRGHQDKGVRTRLDNDPTLTHIEYRGTADALATSAANAGGPILLYGTDLPANGIELLVRDPQRKQIFERPDGDIIARIGRDQIERVAKGVLGVTLTGMGQPTWTSGMLTMEMLFPANTGDTSRPQKRSTNAVPLEIAPTLRMQSSSGTVLLNRTTVNGKEYVQLTTEEAIEESRKVFLILSEVPPPPDPVDSSPVNVRLRSYSIPQVPDSGRFSPKFDISDVQSGRYRLRLRVGGVDSLSYRIITRPGDDPASSPIEELDFDPRFEVEL